MNAGEWIHNLRLPLSVILGPVIWALQLLIGYVLVPVACQTASNWYGIVLGVIAAGLTVAMGFIAFQGWRGYTRQVQQTDAAALDEPDTLGEFFGAAGTMMSILFLILIAATAIYGFFLSPCPVITMPFP